MAGLGPAIQVRPLLMLRRSPKASLEARNHLTGRHGTVLRLPRLRFAPHAEGPGDATTPGALSRVMAGLGPAIHVHPGP